MNSIIMNLDNNSEQKLYIQLYNSFKEGILSGEIPEGSKIPSLRRFAKDNAISITTVETAYNQLLVEGYIESRPKSGYYVSDNIAEVADGFVHSDEPDSLDAILSQGMHKAIRERELIYDEDGFEFSKWKKCMNRVFNDYSHLLRTEADVQGEQALRFEIAKYLYGSRGVKCSPNQIVIGAGSQQLTTHLIRILREIGVEHAAMETPGYGPIRDIFKDEKCLVSEVPVDEDGIIVDRLPNNVRSVVYVSPSNQFPTGAVMPIARRYELIKWATSNDSYILEDDYDSELRYFGKPIPALQGLDTDGRVIYLGSFSSTLFAAIKINYMVLPEQLVPIFDRIKFRYSQTCSKAEQLCLALYMEEGYYHRHIKKCRKMNAGKLETTMKMFREHGADLIDVIDSKSGLAVMLKVKTSVNADMLCLAAKDIGLTMNPVTDLCTDDEQVLFFYFYRVSNALLKLLIKMYVSNLRKIFKK